MVRKNVKPTRTKRPPKEPIVEIPEVTVEEEAPKELAAESPPSPEPNIQYSIDPKYPEPPRRVRIGMKVYDLPEPDIQRAGFYSEDAKKLAQTIKAYKLIQPKG